MADIDNTIDYTRFKTPFFKVEIGSSELIELPMQILKLISRLEIMETVQGCNHNLLKLTFIEGSREPYPKQEGTSAAVYKGGDFSNHTGFVVDLKQIAGSGGQPGFTLASTIGDAISAGNALNNTGSTGITGSGEEDFEDEKEVVNNIPPEFLFSPRNRIRVTWGYAEDPENQRVFSGRISILNTNFPETGHPQTEITALGTTSELDQLTTKKGKLFKATSGLNQFAGALGQEDEDIPIGDLLDSIGSSTGFEILRSDSFDAETLDPGKAKVWAAGKSLHQFLRMLARRHHAVYTVIEDFSSGNPAIVFIRKEEFNSFSILPKNLMFYRQPGSILKSVNIKADFSSIVGKTNVGVNEDKAQIIRASSSQGKSKLVGFEGQKALDVNPSTGTTASPGGKAVLNLSQIGAIGHAEYTPENSIENLQKVATNEAACSYDNVVALEFSTIGFPNVKPGAAPFQGLGRRYSGFYSIQQVSHIIDSSGYTCRGIATGSNSSGEEGVTIPVKGQELSEGTTTIKGFHEKTKTKVPSGGKSDNISFKQPANIL